jgi:hypothetical protein
MPGLFSRLYTKATGQVIEAAERNAEFQNIIDKMEPQYIDDQSADATAMRAVVDPGESGSESLATTLKGELERLRFAIKEIKGTTYWYQTADNTLANNGVTGTVPVGTIVAHYDFNAAVNISSEWLYCNGQEVDDADSPLDDETLPDLSNRYLVGFGTEGGEDNDDAAWNVDAVGAVSHQVDISHIHTGPSHTHTGPSHNHTWFTKGLGTTGGTSYNSAGNTTSLPLAAIEDDAATDLRVIDFPNASGSTFYTNNSGTGNTGASGTGNTGSALSATQSIQPRSVRVRWIMRIK